MNNNDVNNSVNTQEDSTTTNTSVNNTGRSAIAYILAALIFITYFSIRGCKTTLDNQTMHADLLGYIDEVDEPVAKMNSKGNVTIEGVITSDVNIGDVTILVKVYDDDDVLLDEVARLCYINGSEKVKYEIYVSSVDDAEYYTLEYIY